MLARAATVPIAVRFIGIPQSPTCLARCHDVDVDPGAGREPRDPAYDRAPADQLLPATALAGANDDVRDLLVLSVFDQGTGQVVGLEIVPDGTHVRRRLG